MERGETSCCLLMTGVVALRIYFASCKDSRKKINKTQRGRLRYWSEILRSVVGSLLTAVGGFTSDMVGLRSDCRITMSAVGA